MVSRNPTARLFANISEGSRPRSGAVEGRRRFSLADLLRPHSLEQFFAEVWERRPLCVQRKDPTFYSRLLNSADLEELIANVWDARPEEVELLHPDPETTRVRSRGSLTAITDLYGRGATIRCRNIQHYWPPVSAVCRDLEEQFGAPVAANVYCTPPRSLGLRRHFDRHDTLILQITGAKRWKTARPTNVLPLQYSAPLPFETPVQIAERTRRQELEDVQSAASITKFDHEVTLQAGDLLYLPRGYIHEAATQEAASTHLTIGVYVFTWYDALVTALTGLALRYPELRKAVPTGFRRGDARGESERLASIVSDEIFREANLRSALDEIAARFGAATGKLSLNLNAGAAGEIGDESIIRRRSGVVLRLMREDGRVGLRWGHKTLWAPPEAAQALQILMKKNPIKVREIGGGLSDKAKLLLAKRLVREGAFALKS